jgi:hypothetical protein
MNQIHWDVCTGARRSKAQERYHRSGARHDRGNDVRWKKKKKNGAVRFSVNFSPCLVQPGADHAIGHVP